MQGSTKPTQPGTQEERTACSDVLVALLKGVVYQEERLERWAALLRWQGAVTEFMARIGLDLVLDEAEGYAFLRSKKPPEGEGEGAENVVPRLLPRRQLSYTVSLLLALLRKKLAEFDAQGAETRLVLSRDDIVQTVQIFLPETSNETKLVTRIDASIAKIEDMGFLRRLKNQDKMFEVRRILKSFVDAQWLSSLDEHLEDYKNYLASEGENIFRRGPRQRRALQNEDFDDGFEDDSQDGDRRRRRFSQFSEPDEGQD